MYVVTVLFEIVPGRMAEFLPRMIANARQSLADEPGCRQFDVCADPRRPDIVFLYEVYDDRPAFDAHLGAAHFRAFDAATAALVAKKTVATFERRHP